MDHSTPCTIELSFNVDKEDLLNSVLKVVEILRPSWKQDSIKYKVFSDGITNSLVGVVHDDDKANMILVRVFGENTDTFIDRDAELANMKILHTLGFGPALYASFHNGLAYQYLPGEILTVETCLDENVYRLVAEKMANFHLQFDGVKEKLPPEARKSLEKSVLWAKLKNLIKLYPQQYSSVVPPKETLYEELRWLKRKLKHLNNHLVFCHNDLLLANILHDKDTNSIQFIDFEYAGPNYQAYDIANHFCEFSGVENYTPSHYPCEEFRKKWVTHYLKTFYKNQSVENKIVLLILEHIELFTLASHFFWGVWAIIQAEHSSIDFDFIRYASLRWSEYFKKKATV